MILISILGDFHSSIFPLYYEFKDKITKHIVVHDAAFRERNSYKKILKSFKKFNKKNSLNIQTEEFSIDEDSLKSIQELIKLIENFGVKFEDIYINATDGLSNIGVVLGSKLLKKGVNILSYDMYENSYNLTTKDNMKNIKLQSKMSIKNHFYLKGIKIETLEDISFAHRYKSEIIELFEKHGSELDYMKKDVVQQSRRYAQNYKNAKRLIDTMGLDFLKDSKQITGGLFEFYVYLIIKDLGFDDILVGVKVSQKISDGIKVENEFDILLMKDNHLHMIECKFTKHPKISELVYKYSTLINLIDDDGRVMILTNEPVYKDNIYDRSKTLQNHRRAFLNKIALRGSVLKHKELFLDDVKTMFL